MAGFTEVSVGGFKSLKNVQELQLSPLNVLIGANGSGKSNLISLFQLLRAIGDSRLQLFVAQNGYANRLLYYGAKTTPMMWCSVRFPTKTGAGHYYLELAAAADDALVFAVEDVATAPVKGGYRTRHQLGAGQRETRLTDEALALLNNVGVYHFEDTSPNAPIRKACRLDDDQRLHEDGRNLAAFLYRLKRASPQVYGRIVGAVRQVAPFFEDFSLAPQKENDSMILLRWTDHDSTYVFSADQLSDGTLRAIATITLLLQPENDLPPIIAIDEPELGLHPYAIEVLASLLRRASATSQVVVATQSVAFVNQFHPEDIIVATREQAATGFERLRPEQLQPWLDEYAVGDLWRKNVVGGSPYR